MSWWRFWVRKPKVSVQVEQAAYDRYVERAKELNVSVSDLVRIALDRIAPIRTPDGSDAAFQALDQLDARALPSRSAPPRALLAPRRIESLPPPVEVPDAPLGLSPGHPCAHYDVPPVPGRMPATCRAQNGRPCAFNAPVAAQCDLFMPRRRH